MLGGDSRPENLCIIYCGFTNYRSRLRCDNAADIANIADISDCFASAAPFLQSIFDGIPQCRDKVASLLGDVPGTLVCDLTLENSHTNMTFVDTCFSSLRACMIVTLWNPQAQRFGRLAPFVWQCYWILPPGLHLLLYLRRAPMTPRRVRRQTGLFLSHLLTCRMVYCSMVTCRVIWLA